MPNAIIRLDVLMAQQSIWLDTELVPTYDVNTDAIPEPAHPPREIVREIMWYLCEGNFRMELFMLDSFLYDAGRSLTRGKGPRKRAAHVRDTLDWFGPSPLPKWVNTDRGFCSHNIDARWNAVGALLVVMQDWRRDPKCILSKSLLDDGIPLKERVSGGAGNTADVLADIIEYEKRVFEHYIRCYFHVFARAPTIPHIFPSPVPPGAPVVVASDNV